MQNLFSFVIDINSLSASIRKVNLKASANQLMFLKDVLKVPNVKRFEADMELIYTKKDHKLELLGTIKAELVLQSVISLKEFTKNYCIMFKNIYDTKMTRLEQRQMEEETDDVPDIVVNGKLDLVEVAVEQLALNLEDYPKIEGEAFAFASEFDEKDLKESPFAKLKNLK